MFGDIKTVAGASAPIPVRPQATDGKLLPLVDCHGFEATLHNPEEGKTVAVMASFDGDRDAIALVPPEDIPAGVYQLQVRYRDPGDNLHIYPSDGSGVRWVVASAF